MSKANPSKAMAAMIPPGQAVIRPMTLGMYAALERIGSPLVTGVEAKDTLELLPSLYLLTHDPREVFRGNILDLAMRWADTQPVEAVAAIKEAAFSQIRTMLDVTPEQDPDKPKKKNDGWIAEWIDWAASRYGWSFGEVMWEVPASALALLRRQEEVRSEESRIYPLQVIEEIDGEQEAQG